MKGRKSTMSSTRTQKLGDKEKKALTIIIPVVLVIILVLIGSITMFMKSDKGQEVSTNAESQFKAITVPEDSSQLTAVSDAPVGREDKNDDENQNVDLLGNPVKRTDVPGNTQTPTSKPKDTKSNKPKDKPSQPAPEPSYQRPSAEDMKQISNIGKRVKIPALNADFALGSLEEPASGVIEPTNFTSVFWVKNRGVKYDKPQSGTVFLAAHALDVNSEGNGLTGLAPGNWLYDPITKQSKLQPGDILEVGGVKYEFVESRRAGKGLIARDKDIWDEKKPNRLIWISCVSNSNDNWISIFKPV